MAAYYRVYDSRHLLPRTAKNRDQLRNPTLGNRVWATFTFLVSFYTLHGQADFSTDLRAVTDTIALTTFRSCLLVSILSYGAPVGCAERRHTGVVLNKILSD